MACVVWVVVLDVMDEEEMERMKTKGSCDILYPTSAHGIGAINARDSAALIGCASRVLISVGRPFEPSGT